MDVFVNCLICDLNKEGYYCFYFVEGIYDEEYKLKIIIWFDDEFYVCISCYVFRFDWLDILF